MREKIEENRKKREAGIAKDLPKEDKDAEDDDRDEKRKRAKSPESQEKLPKRAKTEEKDQDEKKEEKVYMLLKSAGLTFDLFSAKRRRRSWNE